MDKNKELIYRQLMWDYNISPEEIDKVIRGEAQFAGHYDINALFVKMLNNLTWYDILEILQIESIKKLLTTENINKLRQKNLKEKYERLQKILRDQSLSASKWDTTNDKKTQYPILSNRWYGD